MNLPELLLGAHAVLVHGSKVDDTSYHYFGRYSIINIYLYYSQDKIKSHQELAHYAVVVKKRGANGGTCWERERRRGLARSAIFLSAAWCLLSACTGEMYSSSNTSHTRHTSIYWLGSEGV